MFLKIILCIFWSDPQRKGDKILETLAIIGNCETKQIILSVHLLFGFSLGNVMVRVDTEGTFVPGKTYVYAQKPCLNYK